MYRISWDEFERLSVDLYKIIKESNKKYGHIMCVARGGLLIGRLLSEMMDLPLGVISAKCEDNKYIVKEEISSFVNLKGNILLVDDILEETIEEVSKIISKNKNVKKIDVAGIFYRPKENNFVPDFYINKIIDKVWVCFPYQKETLKKHADI
jgi:uncharacterized protein